MKLVYIQKSYNGNPDRYFQTEDSVSILRMNEMNNWKMQVLDKILIGEFTESTFPFKFDGIVILQNKRDWISQEQIQITKKMIYMFLM